MWCTRIAGNAGHKKSLKIRHLGTIAQLCWAVSLQLRHVGLSTIGINLLNSIISSTYPRIWWTSAHIGWDCFGSLGHPSNFQRFSRLGSVTAQHSGLWEWASAKPCGIEQRALPIFGRAAITLGIGPPSSLYYFSFLTFPISIFSSLFSSYLYLSLTFQYTDPLRFKVVGDGWTSV